MDLRDFTAYYAESLLFIKDKNGNIIKLVYNNSQKELDELITQLELKGEPIFIIILKARQIGFSTYTESKIFHRVAMHANTNALIVAHEVDASTNLFNMSKLFYEKLPKSLRPMIKTSNAKELVFENPTNNLEDKQINPGLRSSIRIQTAKNVSGSRSATYQIVHISEIAFWDNPKEAMTAIMQAVAINPKTLVVIESTANGFGDYFYSLWDDSKEGKNAYIPIFVAWFQHEEYQMPAPADFVINVDNPELTPIYGNEQELRELYSLSLEQLYWRRWTIQNKCKNDLDTFRQEYPSNDIEAFLMSGRSRFNKDLLLYYKEAKNNPALVTYSDLSLLLSRNSGKGVLEVYADRKQYSSYLITADVAEGLEKNDYSCLKVFDRETQEQLAEWHGHIEPSVYGELLDIFGTYFNKAVIACERNNHGHTTLARLKQLYELDRIFVRDAMRLDDVIKEEYQAKEPRYGWETNKTTRQLMVNILAERILNKDIPSFTSKDKRELMTFIINKAGKAEAAPGCYDDRVIALAIAYYLLQSDLFNSTYPIEDLRPIKKLNILQKDIQRFEENNIREFQGEDYNTDNEYLSGDSEFESILDEIR